MNGEVEISEGGNHVEVWADGPDYTIKMNWVYTPLQSWPELRSVWCSGADHRELLVYRGLRNVAHLVRPAACVWRILEVEGLIDLDNQFSVLNSVWWREVERAFNKEDKRHAEANA